MKRLGRSLTIATVVLRYRLDALVPRRHWPWYCRLLLLLCPWCWRAAAEADRGDRLRRALEALGPIFVKFGQLLSTRRDLLPEDIANELARLQDQVAPFPGAQAVAVIEQSLGQPVADLFSAFDPQPLASASVAQIHTARLADGREVVVKVIRPGIDRIIRQDLALLQTLARWIDRWVADGRRLRLPEVVADYEHTILDELDLRREAANTSQLRRNFTDSELLYVPAVHWDYCRREVMVAERIHGIPVTDLPRLEQAGIDLRLLAERGVTIFFTQLLRDNFFHADMHPGNIFVDPASAGSPRYIAIDCAIIGSLSDADQYYLARNLQAMFKRDYRAVARLHVDCGWVPATTRAHEFEAAIRSVCEPVFEKPLADISFGKLLIYLFQTARRFDMEVQPSLVLLQKTLLNIEGLGRQLYPQLNLWDTAQPLIDDWLRQRYSPLELWRRSQRELPHWLAQLPELPGQIAQALNQGSQLQQLAGDQQRYLQQLASQWLASQRSRRRHKSIVILALAAAAVSAMPQIPALPMLSWLLLGIAGLAWWRL